MYKLEKTVPIPTVKRGKYPFMEMNVGDSFGAASEEAAPIRNAASQCGRRNNMKFTIRSVGEEVRCWRVS